MSQGELRCYVDDGVMTFTANGIEYGLNRTAVAFGGYREIDEIRPAGPVGYVEVNGERQPVPTYRIGFERVQRLAGSLCPPMSVIPN